MLSIEIDTVAWETRLPPEKVEGYTQVLAAWRLRSSATKRELDSLTGILFYGGRVVIPGRPFVRFGPVSLHGCLWAAGLRSSLRVAVVLGRVDAGYSIPLYTLAGAVRHLRRPPSMGIAVVGEARSVPMR